MQPAQGLRLIQKVKFENGKWVAMGLDGH
jgi:hypothetical protein